MPSDVALVGTPLCPAGHLPHKGGDRQLRRRLFRQLRGLAKRPTTSAISPLEGEMSGRTEGGSVESRALKPDPILSNCSDSKSRARAFLPSAAIAPRIDSVAAQAASTVRPPTNVVAVFALPATAICQATAPLRRSAVSRTSAVIASSPDRPPPSTTTETFGPSRVSSRSAAIPLRIASASGVGSAISSGSSPARGLVSTGTPVRTAMPSVSTSRDSATADCVVSPLICRLPRAVTSTMPLP